LSYGRTKSEVNVIRGFAWDKNKVKVKYTHEKLLSAGYKAPGWHND